MKNNRLCIDCFEVVSQRKVQAKLRYKICSSCNTPIGDELHCGNCGRYWHNYGKKPCIDCGGSISAVATRCDECTSKWSKSTENPAFIRELSKKYNTSEDAVLDIKSSGQCEVCNEGVDTVCIDHCHITGQVRGGLCNSCNTALGSFRDDKQRLESAVGYLSMARSRIVSKKTCREKSFCGCGEVKPARARMCRRCLMLEPSMKYCSSCLVKLDGPRENKTHFCKTCLRRNIRKTWYSLSESDALRLEAVQMCEICKSKSRLCIDHCHKTGAVRGVICNQCNLGLGQARDSVNILQSCIAYLENHEARLRA